MNDNKHLMRCANCNEYFDMRDLNEAFHHCLKGCITGAAKSNIEYGSSRRVGDSVEYTKDKKQIDLN